MIKRILIVFLICITFYSCFVYVLQKRNVDFNGTQNLWQENVKQMQDYIYSGQSFDDVILGSSLSMRILVEKSDRHLFNLAAGGGDPFIGFEIIKRSNKIPKRIFVESNSLLSKKVHDDTYLSTLYRPGFYELRKIMPIFKEQYQPASFLGQIILHLMKPALEGNKTKNSVTASDDKVDKLVKLIASQNTYTANNFNEDKKVALKNAVSLIQYLLYFKSKGVKVVFFEMPYDCEVKDNLLSVYARNTIHKIAEKNEILEIPLPDCEGYTTSDGRHLTESSAIKYTRYFFARRMKIDRQKPLLNLRKRFSTNLHHN
jgi:hypothetical protein